MEYRIKSQFAKKGNMNILINIPEENKQLLYNALTKYGENLDIAFEENLQLNFCKHLEELIKSYNAEQANIREYNKPLGTDESPFLIVEIESKIEEVKEVVAVNEQAVENTSEEIPVEQITVEEIVEQIPVEETPISDQEEPPTLPPEIKDQD